MNIIILGQLDLYMYQNKMNLYSFLWENMVAAI